MSWKKGWNYLSYYQYNKLMKYLKEHYKVGEEIDYWAVEEYMNPLNAPESTLLSIDLIIKLCDLYKTNLLKRIKNYIY